MKPKRNQPPLVSPEAAERTGPASEPELAACLNWDQRRVRQVVSSMLHFKICFLNEHGRLQLSEEGFKQAAWFAKYPERLSYTPGMVAK